MYNPDSPTMKINPNEFGTTEALHWYGIIMQGSYGDNHTPAPSWVHLVDRLKWNAYDGNKGMGKHEARITFINKAKEMFKERGFDIESPLKHKMDKEYEECVSKKLASGETQE